MVRRITMQIGPVTVAGSLRDSETTRAFWGRLPLTVRMMGTGIDFCGAMPFALPYQPELVHHGWRNGDINYNPAGGWLAVHFADEQNSARYGDQLTIGSVEGSLDALQGLAGTFDVRIEAAEGDGR